jgi:hypothetical protein
VRSFTTHGICAGALLVLGCTHQDSQPDGQSATNLPPSTNAPPSAKKGTGFAVRFDAASALTGDTLKQETFAKLAIDAATAGNSDIAKKSLAAIQSDNVRGNSAYKCALLLAKAGQGEDAIAIAKSLASDNQREKALAKIASGDYGD